MLSFIGTWLQSNHAWRLGARNLPEEGTDSSIVFPTNPLVATTRGNLTYTSHTNTHTYQQSHFFNPPPPHPPQTPTPTCNIHIYPRGVHGLSGKNEYLYSLASNMYTNNPSSTPNSNIHIYTRGVHRLNRKNLYTCIRWRDVIFSACLIREGGDGVL